MYNYVYYSPSVEPPVKRFRVVDILGTREMAPRKEACVVVRPSTSSHDTNSPSIASKDLKFGIDRILSDTGSRKDTESPVTAESISSPVCALSCCVSRCCPLPSCRCNHVIEPFPIYPYQTASYPKYATQTLISYPNSLYSNAELDMRMGTMNSTAHHTTNGKRKRSWSRAVFSNLQRKGLEKRFQIQKYITKPDRRQLAATLGLTDAQVKVWFQNRRMKWRHSKEAREQFKAEKKVEDPANSDVTMSQEKSSEQNQTKI